MSRRKTSDEFKEVELEAINVGGRVYLSAEAVLSLVEAKIKSKLESLVQDVFDDLRTALIEVRTEPMQSAKKRRLRG
jgi:hypothetical protein